jgi:creatinine amidohydrolase/Fe(II)-dependent formamide hydrolase-like protein
MLRVRMGVTIVFLMAAATAAAAQQPRPREGEQARRRTEQERRLQEELRAPRPIEGINSVWLEELTWMEVRDAITSGVTTVIIPTGGIEQNGPYLALGKHNYVLAEACEGIARALENALCAPIIKLVPEGDLEPQSGHMRYPGTISLRQETFEAMLMDVGRSLRAHGFTRIIYLGDSGGNQTGMANAAAALNARWGATHAYYIAEFYRYADVFAYMERELGIKEPVNDGLHDDFVITAIMMVHDPATVRYDQRVAAGKATINGLSIAPRERTIEIGRKLLRFRVDQTVRAIRAAIR